MTDALIEALADCSRRIRRYLVRAASVLIVVFTWLIYVRPPVWALIVVIAGALVIVSHMVRSIAEWRAIKKTLVIRNHR